VSGLYAAWRLLKSAKESGLQPPRVAVFELGERIGGRLLTWLPAGSAAGLRAELGGMRFFEEQKLVWELLGQLGFGDEDIVPFYVNGKSLRLLLRGSSMSLDDPEPGGRYLLDKADRHKKAGEVLEEVIKEILGTPENVAVLKKYLGGGTPQNREQWDKVKPYLTWRNRPLWDVGFWNLFSEVRNLETYQYITDSFGYYSLAANWNAAEAMQTMALDFTGSPVYHTLSQGYSALPNALASAIVGLGGKIVTDTRLVSFEAPAGKATTAKFVGPDGPFTVEAPSLVLGLPRRSLELLAPSPDFDLQGNPALKSLVDSVAAYPAFKLFLFFESRWWEKLGIDRGRSICDLPIRQTYYMAPDSLYEGKPTPPLGLIMASYDDARAVEYWQGLVPPADQLEQGRVELRDALAELTRQAGLAEADESIVSEPPPNLHKAPAEMVDHAIEQLALLHGIQASEIPPPVVGAFADWGLDPYGGGWNFWQPQMNVQEAMTKVKTPLGADRSVYLVGESYSGVQGWVEGALSTTELVLEKHFGLARPPWLPADYYLGW